MAAAGESTTGFRVAFQGEKGAYSEQAIFELLGRTGVTPVGFDSFDLAFNACSAGDADLLMAPIENSLGGTIHANYDLQLHHNLFIIAEYDFRVRHCLVALPGTAKSSLTKIMSHHQALAQCDSYIKRLGVESEVAYDTAGSAKQIAEGRLQGVAAICSSLAASHFGLEVVERDIEDDSNNFTRFLLLRADPVRIPLGVKCKTSIVFSLDNVAGALFKALSVFALRDVDLSKIESRPCKPDVMDRLERLFWGMGGMWSANSRIRVLGTKNDEEAPDKRRRVGEKTESGRAQYRYLFYIDFLAAVDAPNAANAIQHLQEITTFFRVLGCYPRGGTLVGLDNLGPRVQPVVAAPAVRKRRLGIIGFGLFGQFMARKMVFDFDVFVTNVTNESAAAAACSVAWCDSIDSLLDQGVEIIIIACSILSFEQVVRKLSRVLQDRSNGDDRIQSVTNNRLLVVDVLSVKVQAKTTMLALLPESCDILCTHPMFGPQSGKHRWVGLPFVYERVRLHDAKRGEEFLKWWEDQSCRMVDMTCELHDELAAGSQFVTHFTGRVLARLNLRTTPINTKGYESLLHLVDNTSKDSFDLFYALYKGNPNSASNLKAIEDAVADVSKDLRSAPPSSSSGANAPAR